MSGIGGVGAAQSFELPVGPDGELAPATKEPEATIDRTQADASAMHVWQAMQSDTQASLLAAEVDDLVDQALTGDLSSEETDALLDQAVELEEKVEIHEELADVSTDMADLTDALGDLESQLASGPSAVEGMTTSEIEDQIAWIQDELDFLYEYEELLLEELGDPSLGTVDSFWVEWDLWDVQFDIDDLESQLYDLQGEVFDRSFDTDSLWDNFLGSFAGAIDGFLNLFQAEIQSETQNDAQEAMDTARRVLQQIATQRLEQTQTDRKVERDTVAAARQQNRGAELTTECKRALATLQPLVAQLKAEPNRELADQLRQQINEIRGPRAAAQH